MITQGAILSRSNVIWYPHNDMEALEMYLQNFEEASLRYRQPLTRRFIITEGIFHVKTCFLFLCFYFVCVCVCVCVLLSL